MQEQLYAEAAKSARQLADAAKVREAILAEQSILSEMEDLQKLKIDELAKKAAADKAAADKAAADKAAADKAAADKAAADKAAADQKHMLITALMRSTENITFKQAEILRGLAGLGLEESHNLDKDKIGYILRKISEKLPQFEPDRIELLLVALNAI
jgi:colicin import membrane protein